MFLENVILEKTYKMFVYRHSMQPDKIYKALRDQGLDVLEATVAFCTDDDDEKKEHYMLKLIIQTRANNKSIIRLSSGDTMLFIPGMFCANVDYSFIMEGLKNVRDQKRA